MPTALVLLLTLASFAVASFGNLEALRMASDPLTDVLRGVLVRAPLGWHASDAMKVEPFVWQGAPFVLGMLALAVVRAVERPLVVWCRLVVVPTLFVSCVSVLRYNRFISANTCGIDFLVLVALSVALVAWGVRHKRRAAVVMAVPFLGVLWLCAFTCWPLCIERARASRARSDVANIGKAVRRLRTDTGTSDQRCWLELNNLAEADCPTACGELPHCNTAVPGFVCWGGPYLPFTNNDPWNHPYLIENSPSDVVVRSTGRNGVHNDPDLFDDDDVVWTDDLRASE